MGRIAIIDDARDILELFEVILNGEHEISMFPDPKDFLEHFVPKSFDVIVLDLVMPEMNGYEVLRRLRENDPDVPVIATTANAQPAERERALQSGCCDCFTKPLYDIDEFRSTVFRRMKGTSKPESTGR